MVAFGTSLAATFGLFEIEVWWELASLITIMVLGDWLEMRAISQASGALNALVALLPSPSFPLFTLRWPSRNIQRKTRGRAVRDSFLVRLFHPQFHAGLARRTRTFFSTHCLTTEKHRLESPIRK
jgi:hypothetical protein